uniref:Uncharacterized protein n=1 Tax=Anthurium amnicola TaxID=1678845 RepID=A0A1D1Y4X8_9ARAE
MADLHQKQGDASVTPADIEFCRGLQELVRDHLDGCMSAALASCSSDHDPEEDEDEDDEAEGPEQLVRRRRRSDLDEDDRAESSAARRRHSRILSRWVARQAEEMLTTIERRNRESELMALAGLHTVSMLNSSFLGESRRTATSGGGSEVAAVEPPVGARAPSILRRWREIEDESAGRQHLSLVPNGNRNGAESRADTSDGEENEYSQWPDAPLPTTSRPGEDDGVEDRSRRSSREQSPDLGEGEGEMVRQIARGWMGENTTTDPGSQISSQRTESPRSEWLGQTERERVRLVREWVQMASEHRDARVGRVDERDTDQDQRSRDGSVTDHEEGQPEHIRRDLLRLRGRQARLDLILRTVRERQMELQGLSEHRAVSDFGHRSRIQSLLRGRFLRNGMPIEEERPPSMAARELGHLRQRRPVSGLREGFRFRLENIVRDQASSQSNASSRHNVNDTRSGQPQQPAVMEPRTDDSGWSQSNSENTVIHQVSETQQEELEGGVTYDNIGLQESTAQGGNWQEEAQDERTGREQSTEVGFSRWNVDTIMEDSDENWQENMDQVSAREMSGNENGEVSHRPEVQGDWHENNSHETLDNGEEGPSDPSRSQHYIPARRVNRFIPPEDDNVYSMELRELLSRLLLLRVFAK